jgi:hypothetical protein
MGSAAPRRAFSALSRRQNGSSVAGVFYDHFEPVVSLTEKGRQYLAELDRRPAARERRRPAIRQWGRGRS